MERKPKGRAEKLRLKILMNLQAIANELKQKIYHWIGHYMHI
jgi:hypothetical protein